MTAINEDILGVLLNYDIIFNYCKFINKIFGYKFLLLKYFLSKLYFEEKKMKKFLINEIHFVVI